MAHLEAPRSVLSRVHWTWHVLLAVAILLIGAVMFTPRPSLLPLDQVQDIASEDGRRQLGLLQVGLVFLAGLCALLWIFRTMLSLDYAAILNRYQVRADAPPVAELVPKTMPQWMETVMWFVLPAWMAWVAGSLYIDDTRAADWTLENGLLQVMTVACYLFGGILAARLTWSHFRREAAPGPRRWWLFALTLGCLMVAGEETNWGQTYLGFHTPEFVREHNLQQEFSLHNMRLPGGISGTFLSNELLWYLAILGGAVLPLAIVAGPKIRTWMWAAQVPLPPWIAQAYCLAASVIPRDQDMLGILSRDNIPSELREVTIAAAVALWMWTLWCHRSTAAIVSSRS
jgi:hypothetical protein